MKEQILTFYQKPHPFDNETLADLPGNTDLKRQIFFELRDKKFFTTSGKGVKGQPILYTVADVAVPFESVTRKLTITLDAVLVKA